MFEAIGLYNVKLGEEMVFFGDPKFDNILLKSISTVSNDLTGLSAIESSNVDNNNKLMSKLVPIIRNNKYNIFKLNINNININLPIVCIFATKPKISINKTLSLSTFNDNQKIIPILDSAVSQYLKLQQSKITKVKLHF